MPFPNYIGKKRLWTRGRVLDALTRAAVEIEGPLPCADSEWNRLKYGRLDWPTSKRILEYYSSMARAWLAAGADKKRISLNNIKWAPQEDAYLLEHAGTHTLRTIAEHLRRSCPSTRSRLGKVLMIHARANQGFLSAGELAREFRCPYHRIRTALREKVIPGRYDPVRNRWEVDLADLTPAAISLLEAPKLHSYRTSPPDLGDYYQRYGLCRRVVDGRVRAVSKGID